MNPNDNQPTPALNADYLNQIAPKTPKKSLIPKNKNALIMLFGVIAVVLVLIIAVVASISASNVGDSERLAAKLIATQDVVDSAKKNIKNPQLRALNSALNIYLTDTIRELTPILEKNNIQITKLSKNATSAESNEEILTTLEDARLNAIYDRIYASEMTHQLDLTLILMQKIYKKTNNSSLKDFLMESYKTLQSTQKQFADFNATDG